MEINIDRKLINRVWDNLRTFIFDNKLLVCCIGAYLCFDKTLESLFAEYLLPIMQCFPISMKSTIVFVLLLVWIVIDFFRKWHRRIFVSNQIVGFCLFMLFLWWKYRLGSDSAYTYISCISFLEYFSYLTTIFLNTFSK